MTPTEVCPHCKAIGHKIFSSGNFVLKGDGWFKDGYSKNKHKFKSTEIETTTTTIKTPEEK